MSGAINRGLREIVKVVIKHKAQIAQAIENPATINEVKRKLADELGEKVAIDFVKFVNDYSEESLDARGSHSFGKDSHRAWQAGGKGGTAVRPIYFLAKLISSLHHSQASESQPTVSTRPFDTEAQPLSASPTQNKTKEPATFTRDSQSSPNFDPLGLLQHADSKEYDEEAMLTIQQEISKMHPEIMEMILEELAIEKKSTAGLPPSPGSPQSSKTIPLVPEAMVREAFRKSSQKEDDPRLQPDIHDNSAAMKNPAQTKGGKPH